VKCLIKFHSKPSRFNLAPFLDFIGIGYIASGTSPWQPFTVMKHYSDRSFKVRMAVVKEAIQRYTISRVFKGVFFHCQSSLVRNPDRYGKGV
jgi:hypothetical protein